MLNDTIAAARLRTFRAAAKTLGLDRGPNSPCGMSEARVEVAHALAKIESATLFCEIEKLPTRQLDDAWKKIRDADGWLAAAKPASWDHASQLLLDAVKLLDESVQELARH